MCLAIQDTKKERIESNLNADMQEMADHCRRWRLLPSVDKSVAAYFHLANRLAGDKLSVMLNGKELPFDPTPVYLGVTLDRSLTYKAHCDKVAAKLAARNNIVRMLAGTTWGAKAKMLRQTTLALVYSSAEYCCSTWMRSTHVKKVDVRLNEVMRTVSVALRATPPNSMAAGVIGDRPASHP